jgi:hypothetical protein
VAGAVVVVVEGVAPLVLVVACAIDCGLEVAERGLVEGVEEEVEGEENIEKRLRMRSVRDIVKTC